MSKERAQLLDNLGFIWDPLKSEWHKSYRELKRYVDKNGNAKVPKSVPLLGNWVSMQRRRKNQEKLSQERIQLLDDIGFIWDAPRGPR